MNCICLRSIIGLLLLSLIGSEVQAGPPEVNYDESQVPRYTLPDPLMMADGEPVTTADIWRERRRPEILELFRTHVYGHNPEPLPEMRFEVTRVTPDALGGKAIRKEISVYFAGTPQGPRMELLIHLPIAAEKMAAPRKKLQRATQGDAKQPVPIFLVLNFRGNHSIHSDPTIPLSQGWFRNNESAGYADHRATDRSRGCAVSRWPIEKILSRGYGLATIYYGDIDPDFDDQFQNGVHPLFYQAGQQQPAADQWGSIGAWAWGLSRAMDYFATDRAIDHQRVAVLGHSRLGKTALWAGAQDERFAMVISNNSGCGGAALSRRRFGEKVARINTAFPHWFCTNFKQYNDREDVLPVDQHQLIGLIAPRPVYIASAVEDRWADPHGEFLAAYHAGSIYRLLGKRALHSVEMPPINLPVFTRVGYHVRTGKHDVTDFDWQAYMDFADMHLSRSANAAEK
jgi:hypothetical protein